MEGRLVFIDSKGVLHRFSVNGGIAKFGLAEDKSCNDKYIYGKQWAKVYEALYALQRALGLSNG